MKIRKTKGFTLAELLIVIAIIGVLVAVSIPIYKGLVEKARQAAYDMVMRQAKSAFVVQELTTGKKPGPRAVYDNISNTFIERGDYVWGRDVKGWYKFYGQAYNPNGGKDGNNVPSKGTNAHIYVDKDVVVGGDYGPDDLLWWAAHKKPNDDRWWDYKKP